MTNPTTEAFAYIEREYEEAKRRVALQRRVVEQLHTVESHPGDAESSLNALLDDESSRLGIMDYLRKWRGGKLNEK